MSKINELEKSIIIIALYKEINERQNILKMLENKETLEHMESVSIKIKIHEIKDLENLLNKISKSKILIIFSNLKKLFKS